MRFLWLLPIAFVVGLDQLTKFLIVQRLEEYESIPIIDGVLNFTRIPNDGAAFGMLDDYRWVFMIASTVVIIAVLIFMFYYYKKYYDPLLYTSLSFVVGGGIGNMIDRVLFVNVVDFIDVRFIPFWKWIFNVADIFVCVGAGLMFLYFILSEIRDHREKKQNTEKSTTEN